MPPLVLILSTYPFVIPQHGGQVRLANIAKAYKEAGWLTDSIAIYPQDSYGKETLGSKDLPFPKVPKWQSFNGRSIPLIDDFLTGIYASSDHGGFPLILKRLPAKIDAVHVEQPWLWPVAKRIKSLPCAENAVLVYGSQNIEAPLKKEILVSYNVSEITDVVAAIDSIEKQAAREADVSFAVTEADRRILVEYGSKRAILASNGIAAWNPKPPDIEKWRKKLPTSPWILYVASAHPPNFTGVKQVIGDSLGFLAPNSRLVVAGSVSEHVYRVFSETRWKDLNNSRLQLLYTLSDDDLAAVKSLAHAFLLPIGHGGGSNIKTAEAIYSGAYVIGTSAAFRGYESLMDLPEIQVADSPTKFQIAIQNVLKRPMPYTEHKNEKRCSLLWENCLASIPENVRMTGGDYGK